MNMEDHNQWVWGAFGKGKNGKKGDGKKGQEGKEGDGKNVDGKGGKNNVAGKGKGQGTQKFEWAL